MCAVLIQAELYLIFPQLTNQVKSLNYNLILGA